MSKFNVGDEVYIPSSRFPETQGYMYALKKVAVTNVIPNGRSIDVDVGGNTIKKIATALANKDVSISILEIGDYLTEISMLDPICRSIHESTRILIEDGAINFWKIRTADELKWIWSQYIKSTTILIIVGHGSKTSLKFGNTSISIDNFISYIAPQPTSPITILSMCCQTGGDKFGKKISSQTWVEHYFAPYHSVHVLTAAQFCINFLTSHLIKGSRKADAFKHAANSITDGTIFRHWKNGVKQ